MGFCDQTILLSLLTGVILGVIYLIFRRISLLFEGKKLLSYCLDFTFAVITCMVIFIVSLTVDYGHIRLFQIAPQIIGFCATLYALQGIFGNIRKNKKINKKLVKK